MSYTQKYLKYKSKYLELKYKMRGGAAAADDFNEIGDQGMPSEPMIANPPQFICSTCVPKDPTFKTSTQFICTSCELDGVVRVTPDEQVLFNELIECATSNGVILRVAGGWVRDKILGLLNDDIDIVIDKKTGKEFSDILCKYVNDPVKALKKNGWSCKEVKRNEKGESNALQTATLIIKLPNNVEFELDFVGLRKEEYKEGSRVPIIVPATPEEDAKRRDITINSLFYNIHTREIEDYIGGVEDLKQKIIRAPIDTMKTLCDDPLRMLRALRFLSRFNFKLDTEIKRVMATEEFKEALVSKVNKELTTREIKGFFKGLTSKPLLAFNEIYNSGLWNTIFGGNDNWGAKSIEILNELEDHSIETVMTALTLPLAMKDMQNMEDSSQPLDKKAKTIVDFFYLEKLNFGVSLLTTVKNIYECIFSINNLDQDSSLWKCSTIGIIIFKAGDNFNNALNIIKVLNKKFHAKLVYFININKLTIQNINAAKINGSVLKNDPYKVSPKKIGLILDHIWINTLDNPLKPKDELIREAIAMNP